MAYVDKPWQKSYFVGPFKLKKSMEPYPEISVYQFLEDSATNYPENKACVFLDKEITYEELKLQVDKFATALADLGVKKGDNVATILPTCPQFIICDYAIMRLGAVHVPLSILHKGPELLYELNESKTEIVISSFRRLERIQSIKDKTKLKTLIHTAVPIFPNYSLPEIKEIPGTYHFESLIEKYDPHPPEVIINPREDVALLPFTGGTTGVPKGTMLTHYNLTTNVIQSMHWMMDPLKAGIKSKAATAVCVPIFHQYGHWVVHMAMSWALRLFMLDPRDLERIVQTIKKYRPFIVAGVPTHYMRLLKYDIPKMQTFFYSGAAALPPIVAEEFEKKIGVPMGEGYGMTEATACTHLNLSALSKVTGFMTNVKRSIGIPCPDTEVKLIDPETGVEAPPGETGELWIRGPQVMKGYWPTPGKGLSEDGWLATGDIGKMDEDGYFYIVDRIKDMINVSGMKVYSRLIDDLLQEHPSINIAGVIGIPDPERLGSERVKAFVTLKEEYKGKISIEDIIEYCKEKLPPYAVPKEVVIREELPLTLALKIFKKKLREEETT